LISYTKGYRYDFINHKISEVGLLLLETKPELVNIYINDKLKYLQSPIHDNNITTGTYDIKASKEGYHTWEKKLPILNKLTTFAQNIILFKKTKPVNIIKGDFDDFIPSFKNNNIFTLWQDDTTAEIWNYNLKDSTNKLLFRNFLNNAKIKIESLSINETNLLLNEQKNDKNHYFIIKNRNDIWNNNDVQIIYLDEIIKQPIQNVKWDDVDNNIIFIQSVGELYSVNINNKNSLKLLAKNSDDFIVYEKILYHNQLLSCLIEINKNYALKNNPTKDSCLYTFSNPSKLKLVSSTPGLATILSDEENDITVINLNNKKQILQKKLNEKIDSEKITWNMPSNKMLYYNDFEINTFAPAHQDPYKEETISRYSDPIQKVLWYPLNFHLIAMLSNSIKIIELDTRDKRNIVEYQNLSGLKNIYIDPKGENIYFLGENENEKGIFQINVF
jgi:hypothetical protein